MIILPCVCAQGLPAPAPGNSSPRRTSDEAEMDFLRSLIARPADSPAAKLVSSGIRMMRILIIMMLRLTNLHR
jgi:hypothetical protein